ncbi:MAG: exosortase B [Candidatus Methylumidiphilus sp.]
MQSTVSADAPMSALFIRSWWPVLVGLLALYLPTYYNLSQTLWTKDEYIHGPMILAAAIWLIWRQRETLAAPPQQTSLGTWLGGFALAFGLLLYAVGRSQDILLFEIGSQIPVLCGVLLVALGVRAAFALWFPLFFLLFMIPLPSFVVDTLTGPLKQQIAILATNSLYALGYPIARSGVVLTIGQYELEVANACSGLHSMFSLSAMGLLYLYLLGYPGLLRNALLAASILPIAFIANVMRVIILVLVTYYFGDAAGQGFLHGFAGIILFAAALILLFLLDGLLDLVFKDRSKPKLAA